MRHEFRWLVFAVALVVAFLLGSSWGRAQYFPTQPTVHEVISGDNIGFRVIGKTSDGRPVGRLVVRKNGEWLEVSTTAAVQKVSDK